MNVLVRVALLLAGLATVFAATSWPQTTTGTVLAMVSVGLTLASLVAAHLRWNRPYSDAVAWLGAIGFLTMQGSPTHQISMMLLITLGVAALAAALHLPANDTPRSHPSSIVSSWAVVAVSVFLIAWGPTFLRDGPVLILDPFTSTGIALRLIIVVGVMAGIATILGRYKKGPSDDVEVNG